MAFPSPAAFGTFNLGQTVRDAEAIKGARIRNAMLGQQLEERQNIIKNRERARQIRQQVEQTPAQIEAMEAAGMFEEAGELRNSYINQRVNTVKLLDGLRESLNADNYQQFRQDMIQAGAMEPSMLPTEYSDDWWREKVNEERGAISTLTRQWGAEGRIMEQDLVTQDGEIIWEGQPFETTGSRTAREGDGGAGGKFTASDSNAIARASAELYGGFYDPVSGRFSGLNREEQQQIAALNEEAERIFKARGGALGHRQAVAEAARIQGVQIQSLQGRRNDPAGIR